MSIGIISSTTAGRAILANATTDSKASIRVYLCTVEDAKGKMSEKYATIRLPGKADSLEGAIRQLACLPTVNVNLPNMDKGHNVQFRLRPVLFGVDAAIIVATLARLPIPATYVPAGAPKGTRPGPVPAETVRTVLERSGFPVPAEFLPTDDDGATAGKGKGRKGKGKASDAPAPAETDAPAVDTADAPQVDAPSPV